MPKKSNCFGACMRKKTLDHQWLQHTEWLRHLNAVEYISFGIGASFSTGVFVLVPDTIRNVAGPSTILAAIIAFMIALLVAFHQCELSIRYPKCGLVYSYAYAAVGEFLAFMCGWVTLIDYILILTLASKQLSIHFRFLFNRSFVVPMNVTVPGDFLDDEFDYLAIAAILFATIFACTSLKVLSIVILILCTVTVLIVSSSILVGLFYADTKHWIQPGTFSHGAQGLFRGAAKLLAGFLGVETLCSLVEESKKSRSYFPYIIPLLSVACFVYFFLIAVVLTLVQDYSTLPAEAILPAIYGVFSVPASRYVLSIGSICGLSGAVFALQVPFSRVLYAMGADGLLCQRFSYLTSKNAPATNIFLLTLASVILVLFRDEFLSNILLFTVPLRFLMVLITGLLVRYNVEAASHVYQSEEIAFRHMKPRKLMSYMNSNGSIVSDHIDATSSVLSADDTSSITSSFVARNVAVLSSGNRATGGLTNNRVPTRDSGLTEASSLLGINKHGQEENQLCLTRTCSKYSARSQKRSKSIGSFSTIELNNAVEERPVHNCIRSPCTPTSDDMHIHLYDRDQPEMPYFSSSHYSSEKLTEESEHGYRKAAILITIYCVISYAAGLLTTHGLDDMHWWTFAFLVISMAVVMATGILIIRLPRVASSVKSQVPASPYLSLFGIFVTTFVVAAAPWVAGVKTLILSIPGIVIYATYSYRHSAERLHDHGHVTIRSSRSADEHIILNRLAESNQDLH